MAAGLGYIEFATGDILTAAAANGYLASQTVMVFASSAARASAITSPQEGMFSYLKDTNATEYYSGSAWTALGGGGGTGGLTLISTNTPSAASSVDFTGISSDYKQLCVTWTGLYASTNNTTFRFRLNSDSAANYHYREIEFSGSTPSGYFGAESDIPCFVRTTSTSASNSAAGYLMIYNTNSTTLHKYMEGVTSYTRADTSANVIRRGSWNYASTSAISSINFFRSETAGTISAISGGSIQLWGLK